MINEYIRRQDVMDLWNKHRPTIAVDAIEYGMQLKRLPSADVVQVVHGKWMKEDRGHVEYCAVCDQCGFDWMWSDRGYFKFCPNCGAKMDGERKE